MDDFLKKLKTRVNHLEVPNDGEVNEDALWNSIQEGITEDVDRDKPKGFWYYTSFLLVALLFMSFLGIYFSNKNTDHIEKRNTEIAHQSSVIDVDQKPETINSSKLENENVVEQKNKSIAENENGAQDERTVQPKNENINQSIFTLPNQSESRNNTTLQQSEIESTNYSTPIKSDIKETNVVVDIKSTNNIVINENIDTEIFENQNQDKSNVSLENTIPLVGVLSIGEAEQSQMGIVDDRSKEKKDNISTSILPSIFKYVEYEPVEKIIILNSLVNKKSRRKFNIGIFAGSHFLHSKLGSSLAVDQERKDLLNTGFKSQLGYSAAAEVTIPLYKKLRLTTGVEYARSTEQFNFATQWDTTFTGQDPNIIINQSSERTVQHYNQHSFLSIPVLLGMEFQRGKFGFGADLGVGFNFTQSQQGRSLDGNLEVVDFPSNEVDDLLPRPDFYLSYHFRPYVNYQLKKNLKIQMRPDLRFQNYGTSAFYNNMKFSSILTGLQTGIVIDFK